MDIKRIGSSPAPPQISSLNEKPSAEPASKHSADQLVPFDPVDGSLFGNVTLVESEKILNTQNLFENLFQSATKVITDSDVRDKLQEFIQTAKDLFPQAGQLPVDETPVIVPEIINQKAKEMMELAETHASSMAVLSVVTAVVTTVVAVVIAAFTFGAATDGVGAPVALQNPEMAHQLAEELKKSGVQMDPEKLQQIVEAMAKGGQDAAGSSFSIDMDAAFRVAVRQQSGLKSHLDEIAAAVFPDRKDAVTRARAEKFNSFSEALDDFSALIADQHDSIDAMSQRLSEMKETIVQIKEAIKKQETVMDKLEELLPQLVDAASENAGECLQDIPPALQADQLQNVSELAKKVLQSVKSDEPLSAPKIDEMKALLNEIMKAKQKS